MSEISAPSAPAEATGGSSEMESANNPAPSAEPAPEGSAAPSKADKFTLFGQDICIFVPSSEMIPLDSKKPTYEKVLTLTLLPRPALASDDF